MRPSTLLPLARKTATVVVPVTAALACLTVPGMSAAIAAVHPADPPPRSTCTPDDPADFPLTTRIRNAPADYRSGGDAGSWTLELTNTTRSACTGVHPIVVLVDKKRTLRPEQLAMSFLDGDRLRPVRFEASDRNENIGVFEDFPGFTVRPGQTVRVTVRLAVAGGVEPNDVVANAALIQRRNDDGDWVGESNDYRFRIVDAAGAEAGKQKKDNENENENENEKEKDKEKDKEKADQQGKEEPRQEQPGEQSREQPTEQPGSQQPAEQPGSQQPAEQPAEQPGRQSAAPVDELAMTGPGAFLTTAAVVTVLLTTGALLLAVNGRFRRR